MRAEEVIATHGSTDFDAFAAMLAARHLYPGAVVAVGALNRNVRDFYRLHADELDFVVDAHRLELNAVERLIVVETSSASRSIPRSTRCYSTTTATRACPSGSTQTRRFSPRTVP